MAASDYSGRIKQTILKNMFSRLPCCQQSFLTALLRGSAQKPIVKLKKNLRKNCLHFLKNMLSDDVSIKLKGSSIEMSNFDQRILREKMVERLCRTADAVSVRHCQAAFLMGLFVSRGYIQDPSDGFHLEIRLPGTWLPAMFRRIAKHLNLRFKCHPSDIITLFYMKNSRQIEKFLNIAELYDKSIELSDLRATRQLLASVNRQVNFETANINRLVGAAEESIRQIEELLDYEKQEIFTENLKILAVMRVKNPHDSLEALGKRLSPPLTKSAVNHRLRRIKALYEKYIKKSNNSG